MIHACFASNMARKMGEFVCGRWWLRVTFFGCQQGTWPYNMPRACCWYVSWYKSEEKLRTVRRPRTSSTVEISPRTISGLHLSCIFPLFVFVYWHWFAEFEHFNYLTWLEILPTDRHCNGVTAWSCCPIMCKSFNDCTLSIEQRGLLYSVATNFPHLSPDVSKFHGFSSHQERAIGCVDMKLDLSIMRHLLIHQYKMQIF